MKKIILRVVERFIQTGIAENERANVTASLSKNSTIECVGDECRSTMLNEYKVDGKSIWGVYSGRSGVVFLSLTNRH